MPDPSRQTLSDLAETLLMRLYLRATESQHPDALVKDEKAVALVKQIDYDFSRFKFVEKDQVGAVLITRELDRHTRGFLAKYPDAVVVHVGCGLDTRFERVDNGKVEWYDLDLPEVIELRRKLIGGEGGRYHLLACSVLDNAWLNSVSVHRGRPFLFVAECVLMYFEEAQVKSLVLTLKEHFPGSELAFDAVNPVGVWANNFKLGSSKFVSRCHWALKRGKDLESWADGIRLLDEWFLFELPEPRLHRQWMRYIQPLAKCVSVFRYQLGKTAT